MLLNLIVRELDAMGFRDIAIASSSVHPVHAEMIPAIRKGVVTRCETGVNGLIGELVTKGELDFPIVVRSHGGRARMLVTDEVPVDVAFIAAPCCDETGNLNGVSGPSACGSLGYAFTDARYARKVVAVTDNLVPYPASPVSISQSDVDYVVAIDSLGDPKKIVSTTTRVTRDPAGLLIARYAAEVIEAAGLLKDGFSFQTGAGGTSLAVADAVKRKMLAQKVQRQLRLRRHHRLLRGHARGGVLPDAVRRAVLRPARGRVDRQEPHAPGDLAPTSTPIRSTAARW